MGFDDRELVALSGAHALGRCCPGLPKQCCSSAACVGVGVGELVCMCMCMCMAQLSHRHHMHCMISGRYVEAAHKLWTSSAPASWLDVQF